MICACDGCRAEEPVVRALARALDTDVVPEPPAALVPRVLTAASPLLAAHARRATRWTLARAIAAALVPLPAILAVDAGVLVALHGALRLVLPEVVSTYLVVNYGVLLALLLGLTYGAVPVLAARQGRIALEEHHA